MCMKAAVRAGSLSMLLGTVPPAYSQPEPRQKEKGKPEHEPHPQDAKPRKIK